MASVIINKEQQEILDLTKDIISGQSIESLKNLFKILANAADCDYSQTPQPTLKQISYVLCSVTDLLRFLRQLLPFSRVIWVRHVSKFDKLYYSVDGINIDRIEQDLFAAIDNWIMSTQKCFSLIDDSKTAAAGFDKILNILIYCDNLCTYYHLNQRSELCA